jgi:hypothetical protein
MNGISLLLSTIYLQMPVRILGGHHSGIRQIADAQVRLCLVLQKFEDFIILTLIFYIRYIDLLQSVQAASPVLSLPDHVLGSQKDKAVALAVELKQNYETAEAIRNILELWSERKKGVALLDEVDMLLHPLRSELNFPIGEKRELDLAPLRWELPIHLLDAIFYTQLRRISLAGFKPDQESLRILKELSDKIQEGRQQKKLQLEPHLVLLQPSFYDSDLKQLFAQWALIWLKEQESIISDIQTSQASSALIENMLIFVSNQGDRSELLRNKAFIGSHFGTKSIKLLNLTRDWIGGFLSHALSKINRVGYGLLHQADLSRWEEIEGKKQGDLQIPSTRLLLAIPFTGVPSLERLQHIVLYLLCRKRRAFALERICPP